MQFRPKHEPDWEVVDHKEIDLVPTLYDDTADVHYVFPSDISQTFVFDAPSSSKHSPPPSPPAQTPTLPTPPSPKASSLSPLSSPIRRFSRLSSTSSSGSPHFRFRFSRASSSSTSDSSDDDSHSRASSFSCSSKSKSKSKAKAESRKSSPVAEPSAGFTLSQTRDALRFARAQLMAADQVTKLGANVLLFEGWAVTHLRKGNQHRLQVRYSGRPARVSFASPPSSPALPPLLDLLPNL